MPQKATRTASPFNSVVQIAIGLLVALAVALVVFIFFIKVAKPVPDANPNKGNPAKENQSEPQAPVQRSFKMASAVALDPSSSSPRAALQRPSV